jgi:kynureninase
VSLPTNRDDAARLDGRDPISALRHNFDLPPGVIYLDGNSLGPPPAATAARVEEVMRHEWGRDLITSWNRHGWIDLPLRVGDAIAGLIGATPGEVVVTDSTSINLFKLIVAALRIRPDRRVILTEEENFPTDVYIARGVSQVIGRDVELRVVPRRDLTSALDDDVAVVMLTHVDFRTGETHDMVAMTRRAHDAGALALWDLAHSAGALDVDLAAAEVDLAVGCGYKYLNGGPGAPAFAFVASALHDRLETPLPGWMGHASPFEMDLNYRPAPGIAQLLCGTPPILSLVALQCGVATVAEAGIAGLRRTSVDLSELFISLVESRCHGFGLELASPRDPEKRGSQVSFRHCNGYPVMQALITAGVIGDFRAPDLLRFGFAPLYVRRVDIWDAVEVLRRILADQTWDRPEYRIRAKVT